jgi:molecular chaperone GrpE (heat shock protein)
MSDKINVSENLKKLSEIAEWFSSQDQVDVEEGLVKVKEAAGLIKESKSRLSEIQNEFTEIRKQIEDESEVIENGNSDSIAAVFETTEEEITSDKIPF